MEKSKVYFTDFRTTYNGDTMPVKLKKLIKKAGIESIDFAGKFVAIKIHFGELGNVAYLRPQYAKALADVIKDCGGKPFLTDCNTLYPGFRKNALEHLSCAQENGFNELTTGCHVIIADGLRGTDDITVPVEGGVYCKEAYIGRAIMDADIVISLNHFKGHEATGFGGALKNLGMGSGSRAGKMQQHNHGKPVVDQKLCKCCHRCAKECGSDAITFDSGKAFINQEICKGCGRCIGACAFDAISNPNANANEILGCKIAEYTKAVIDKRPNFHINIVCDISPNCDCHAENDAPILPDVGMFASFDPVALDQACADACLKNTPMPNSQLSDNLSKINWKHYHDHFLDSNPNIRWKETLEHGEKLGLGTREYEIIKM